MYALKVHKVGNSLNLRLPKDVANTLRVSEGDVVYLTETTDGGYRITPLRSRVVSGRWSSPRKA